MKLSLRHHQALMVENGTFSHKTDKFTFFKNPIHITGSRVTTILLNGWILPIGWASLVEGLRLTGLPRLVLTTFEMCNGWFLFIFLFCWQRGRASLWRVYYQQGIPICFFPIFLLFINFGSHVETFSTNKLRSLYFRQSNLIKAKKNVNSHYAAPAAMKTPGS